MVMTSTAKTPLSWGPNKIPVPYAAAWTEEAVKVRGLTYRPGGGGLCYRDETPADRDRHGVLWTRVNSAPGEGKPDYRAMHAHRQQHCMLNLLCQICGGPADRTSKGWLFLLTASEASEVPEGHLNWPEGVLSTKPPVCRPCVDLAVRHCPHMADPLLIRSRKPRVWGVFGGFFAPARNGGITMSPEDGHIPYGHPAARWFLASQLVMELTRCTLLGTGAP